MTRGLTLAIISMPEILRRARSYRQQERMARLRGGVAEGNGDASEYGGLSCHLLSSYLYEVAERHRFCHICNALYFEIHGMMSKLEQFGFFSSDELGELEKNIACLGDKVIAGEDAAAERELISSTVYQLLSKMRDLLLDEKFHVKETLEGKLALELDVYIRKLIWRNGTLPIWKNRSSRRMRLLRRWRQIRFLSRKEC